MITRRIFLSTTAAALPVPASAAIDRRALVRRHNPVFTQFEPRSPLSVGNGELAFTADVTGLQTFPDLYEKTTPLCTQSQWGWHRFPAPRGLKAEDLKLEQFDTFGRPVGYPTSGRGQTELFNWLRENPHRLHLGRIALVFTAGARPEDLKEIRQELDLWTGTLESRFVFAGEAVLVRTCVHPTDDAIGVRIESALLQKGQLGLAIEFPYGSPNVNAADWAKPSAHKTEVVRETASALELKRTLDEDTYAATLRWEGSAQCRREGDHRFVLLPRGRTVTLTCAFRGRGEKVFERCAAHWPKFWSTGGAMEIPESKELERRVVLSQYLTAIQCAGSMPPQETGLTCNSWYGKFHLEMHWWHAAHFALWDHTHLLERSLGWYTRILPSAREWARKQGYQGARWPKMVGPDGRDSPSNIGPLLIWQQPHIIAFAELCRQSRPNKATLEKYRDLVFESAEFMASYAVERNGRFVLGPPVIPAQENHPPRETWNPTFELEYWARGLEIAQQWRKALGLPANDQWERVRRGLADLPVKDGVYLAHENCPQTYTERNRDHPSMLGALGVLRGTKVDKATMKRTIDKVFASWRWPDTWGWDYPLTAMTAARLNDPALAVKALLLDTPKNVWLANGHNYQRPGLSLYLPGNGGLLAAVALMAAGGEGFKPAPWSVRHEGLRALL